MNAASTQDFPKSAEIAAFLVAALVPAAFRVAVTGELAAGASAYFVAMLHILIAAPSYYLLKGRLNAPIVVLAGAAIGALPAGLLAFAALGNQPAGYLPALAVYAALGGASATVFWVTLNLQRRMARTTSMQGTLLAGLALLAAAALFRADEAEPGRGCHDLFMRGGAHAQPLLNAEVAVSSENWTALTTVAREFAERHSLAFANRSSGSTPQTRVLELSMCSDRGIRISLFQHQYSAATGLAAPRTGVSATVFASVGEDEWRPIAEDLIVAIERSWPGSVTYRDSGGAIVPESEAKLGENDVG